MEAMIIALRYTVKRVEGTNKYKIHNHDAPFCPSCGSLCSGYDTRSRRVVGDDGGGTIFRLRRVRCPSCDVLHIELPDFMRPLKRYAAAVIDDVLNGNGACCPAEASTMWRWRCENHPPEMQSLTNGNMIKSTHNNKKGDNL
jgi:hypothetical protein